jgi:outer membrane protein insertion porin family
VLHIISTFLIQLQSISLVRFRLLFFLLVVVITAIPFLSQAQPLATLQEPVVVSYTSPETYIVGEINIVGNQFLDAGALKALAEIKVGDKVTIPSDDISEAIKKLWKQGLIEDVKVEAKKMDDKNISITFLITERPRLSGFQFVGVSKANREDLTEKIDVARGKIVTDPMIKNAKKKVKDYFVDKGYLNTTVNITQKKDSLLSNNVMLITKINKNKKVRIKQINIEGNQNVKTSKLLRKMKKTKQKKWYGIFTTYRILQFTRL